MRELVRIGLVLAAAFASTFVILAGYFLGASAGAAAAATGMLAAGITGYWLSRRYGTTLLGR